ncbi:ectonucleoside triphosphate diphosphohydrolase 6 [Cricetulus griseus]
MRKIPNHGTLRMTKVAYPLGLCVGLFIYVAYIKWHRASAAQAFFTIAGAASGARWTQQAFSSPDSATHSHEVFYGIMFDAGSTGTRIHVFQFARLPGETPTLTHETFKALKPGLSAYADDVEKSAQGIQELLNVAKQHIPYDFWKATPLVLKATAGLRLLPGEKAQKLLQKVKEVFKASPFLVGDDCVSIMNGTDEAEDDKELVSPCLSSRFRGEWEHAEVTYRISGQKAEGLYELCASRVSDVLRNKVHRAEEAQHVDFYAFSYYYDLAANFGLIDAEKGGSLVVGDFETAAKYGEWHCACQGDRSWVCRTLETQPPSSSFACMDLTYISLLLREFGFPRDKVLKDSHGVTWRSAAPSLDSTELTDVGTLRRKKVGQCLFTDPVFQLCRAYGYEQSYKNVQGRVLKHYPVNCECFVLKLSPLSGHNNVPVNVLLL